ncbi:MAG: molybdopterin-guanine dinucleotide biosynthesis protein MobA [Aeromicrobium sp.]|nr:molybdopterin-guanine dinucleotide biosynthesis protein MobA [Aeromicrobium sp.]
MDVGVIVLAGGRGSRLGGIDKATLELDGESMLDRALRAVADLRVVVVGTPSTGAGAKSVGATVVQEQPRFAGPAAAIGAGLAEVTEPYVLIVPCDQAHLDEVVPLLRAAHFGGADGVVAVDPGGRRQHLLCLVRTEALRGVVVDQPTLVNLSVRALLDPLDLVEVPLDARAALDIDTWHDHEKAAKGAIDD